MVLGIGSIVILIFFLLRYQPTSAAQVACTKDYYGAPAPRDCEELLNALPHDDQLRLFDEEQMRAAEGLNFPGVKNAYSSQVFQVPAYWSLSMPWPLLIFCPFSLL